MPGLIDLMAHGLAAVDAQLAKDVALGVVRASAGVFFACSGWNKLTNANRHAALVRNLTGNKLPAPAYLAWWVAGWEFLAGAMLAAGLLSAFVAVVLTIICLVAICCEAADKVERYGPINRADRVADWLYLPEVLYVILLAVNVIAGTGRFSLDHLLF
jgi:putative oxidoreductase